MGAGRDPFRQIERLLSEGGRVPHLYFDVGSSDRYANQSRAFADTLRKRGVPHVFKEWPGDHDRAFWRDHAGEGLAWVLSQIGP